MSRSRRALQRLIGMIRQRRNPRPVTVEAGAPLPDPGKGMRYVLVGSWPNPMRRLTPAEAEAIIRNTNVKVFLRDPMPATPTASGTAS